MTMNKWLMTAGLALLLTPAMSFAVAPVEDYSEPENGNSEEVLSLSKPAHHGAQALSVPDRLQRLETKVDNIAQANASSRLEELQQIIQELRGQLEKQGHELELLTANQKSFYQDLNNRISQQQGAQPAQSAQQTPATVAVKPVEEDAPAAALVAPSPNVNAAKAKNPASEATPSVQNDIPPGEKSTPSSVAKPDPSAAQSNVSAASGATGEQALYQQGFALLKSKQYDRALTQFKDYVTQYPKGRYAANANFWMGEINYLQGKHTAAKKSFETVVKNYPKDQKIPDALLKLAIIATDMGQKQKAEVMLGQIQKQYPGTTAARLAMIRAQELRLSTH